MTINVGDTLVINHGVWDNPPPTEAGYQYQFIRLDQYGQNPVVVRDWSLSNQYVVQVADNLHRIQPGVRATNSVGTTTSFGSASEIIGTHFGGGTGLEPWQYGEAMPAWIRVNGQEIANWARTMEYLKAGLAGPGLTLQRLDACPILYDPDNVGTPAVFADPKTDNAPWYDPARPESEQFLGVVVNNVVPTPQEGRTATTVPGRFGGSNLSAISSGGMTLAVTATLVAASVSGAEYGEEWLRAALADPMCDACGTSTVEYRRTCPPSDGSNPSLGYWIGYQAGVTSPPTLGAQDALGIFTDLSWTWTSEDAYLYKPPSSAIPSEILNPSDVPGPCTNFDDWLCGPGHNVWCGTIDPPNKGAWGTIITIQSPDGVGETIIATYTDCPPDLTTDTPISQLLVTGVQGTLIIDSSQHLVTYISSDGSEVRDGTDKLFVPDGEPFQWIEVEDCDPSKCVCVSTTHPCSGGGNTTVQLDLQYRRR
jgi:hypothetical protein